VSHAGNRRLPGRAGQEVTKFSGPPSAPC
jgi:hypothetical protein